MIFDQTAPSCIAILDDSLTETEVFSAFFLCIIAAISMFCSSFIAMFMYLHPPLQKHPNWLIFWMFISEAIAANASLFDLLSGQWVICYFNLNVLYTKTTGVVDSELAF
jgi:hypothetical protein